MEPPRGLLPEKNQLAGLLAVVTIATVVAFCCHVLGVYFSDLKKPYCDRAEGSVVPISESCKPCPSNGECRGGRLQCARGYRKSGSRCIEDHDTEERHKKLAEWVESNLCGAAAQFLCGGSVNIWIQEDAIWNNFPGSRPSKIIRSNSEGLIFAKRMALEAIDGIMETRVNTNGKKELKCPNWLAESYKPLACRVRQWIIRHSLVVFPLLTLVLGPTGVGLGIDGLGTLAQT